ncbi:flagellar hook-length control protein FliK [Sutcliffiella horikoshii]|uniref:flagellar hook-length control protein FliK n=1 Tax=Sutcliffiella horikoshii TaxID=79883 RepID=UPI001653E444|nr:flagellar hook-length control protein FliK [Sutcliffiella horikoshii]
MNFFVTGVASASVGSSNKMINDGVKKSEQLTENTSDSFRFILSESFLSTMLSLSKPISDMVEDENATIEKLIKEMDETLTLQLALLNELQEWRNMESDTADTKELPKEYFHLLEDVMAMMSLLANQEDNIQGKVDKQLIQPFTQVSERVMMFIKSYMMSVDEKTDLPITTKEQSNVRDLLKAIDSKLGKVEQVIKGTHQALQPSTSDSPTTRTAFVPNNETFLQNGPVTMNLLQQPKQTTIQWVVDTTTNEVAREQLMQKLEGILSKTTTKLVNGNQSMTIRLAPEHLGTLHIKLQETQNGLVTKLIVHSKSAASLLESGMTNLKQTLAQTNTSMDKIEVVFLDQDQKLTQHHKGSNEENAQQKQSYKQDKQQDDSNQSFEDVLLEELEIKIPEGERT